MRQLLFLTALWIIAATSPAATASGLLAPTDQTLPPLRITDHLVDVKIQDQVAITTITQRFRNDTSRRLEGRYVFPLPEDADLTNFEMSFNGKMVTGRVLPKDEARRIYESIVRQSRDPGLIEFIGRRLLQMRVFPIEPRSETTISLRYQQVCRPVSGMHGYHYPLRTGSTDGRAYGVVRFNVSLATGSGLKNIWSPSHAVEIVRRGDHEATIAYEADGGSLEEDFLLLYDTDSSDLGLSVIAHRPRPGQPGHFVLLAAPRQLWSEQSRQPQDVVFVVDTSGSMAGEKLAQVREALKYCVRQLDEADRFSVVRFSTGFDALFDPLEPATREATNRAAEWIEQFRAAGGTNIGQTLQHVMTLRAAAKEAGEGDRPFVVVFLTDGQGNREADAIMAMLDEATGEVGASLRIFPFGVGHDVNTVLLDRMANEHHGRPTFVQPGENLELVLGDFFSIVSRPVLTKLKLTLPDISATERFPAVLGDLYHGQQVVVAGCFDRPMVGPVKLTAVRNGVPVEYVWPNVAFTDTPDATYVPSVWAGRKIAYLVDEIRQHGENQEMIKEILELSQAYGIQTPYTSWLVDPERRPVMLGQQPAFRGGGVGGDGALGRRLRGMSRSAPGTTAPSGGPSPSAMPDSRDLRELETLADGMARKSGESATALSRVNAALRERTSLEEGRLDDRVLPRRNIGGRWYDRIGSFLVDERVREDTPLTTVRFASDAYFELVDRRPELRDILATGRSVVVMVADGQAVIIADEEGVETFTDEQRATLQLHQR